MRAVTLSLLLVSMPLSAAQAQELIPLPTEETSASHWLVGGDYVLWWLRRAAVPVVLTTGPAGSTGVLGQPGTQIVYGDERLPTRHGDRFFGGRVAVEWQGDGWALEGRAFFLERDSTYFTIKPVDSLLALSFLDANTNQETSEVVAGFDPQRGPLRGGFVGYSRIELFGEEANGVLRLDEGEDWKVDLLVGARFLQMRDRYHHTATSRSLPDLATIWGVVDNYRIHNAYYGGQIGLRGDYRLGRFHLDGRLTAGLGANSQLVRTFGNRVFHNPQIRLQTTTGLFVQPSNRGRFRRTDLDSVGELACNIGYDVTTCMRLVFGYTFLYWADPIRAASQLDRVINQQQPDGPARPALPWKGEAFWAQGINLGLHFRW